MLDADAYPVAGANVNLNGDGQPNVFIQTDKAGRFRFEQVCAGPAQIMADFNNAFGRNTSGQISAAGGDPSVVLRLGSHSGRAR